MNGLLDEQIAVVTGAAGGLGRAIADELHASGAQTCYLDIRLPDDVSEIEARRGAVFAQCDVGDDRQVASAAAHVVEELGTPTILVNNAGSVVREGIADTPPHVWNEILRTNLTGPYLMARQLLPMMRGAGYGRLIHLTSVVADTGGAGNVAAYAAAKAGLTGLARAIAVEYAPSGVTSNSVAPAWINDGMFAMPDARPERVPVGRFGAPNDVVAAVCYLASPAAGFVTGQVIHVNGGLHFG